MFAVTQPGMNENNLGWSDLVCFEKLCFEPLSHAPKHSHRRSGNINIPMSCKEQFSRGEEDRRGKLEGLVSFGCTSVCLAHALQMQLDPLVLSTFSKPRHASQ